jgi:pantoate--beta-alanine ligase
MKTPALQVVTGRSELEPIVRGVRLEGRTIGLVPTMGALHAGHLSLVDASLRECDYTVVTIFVNPTQFGPHEDYQRYPRTLEDDLRALEARQVDLVFAPPVSEMYLPGHETFVEVGASARLFEGPIRSGHFRGVATIVLKLMHLIPADTAFFGRKDYQQSIVVRKMVEDLNVPLRVVTCPIVRDADGLALSSRNVYLTSQERQRALSLPRTLELAGRMVAAGERDTATIRAEMLTHLKTEGDLQPEYIAFLRDGTMESVERIDEPTTIALAARVGATRLIDNLLVAVTVRGR